MELLKPEECIYCGSDGKGAIMWIPKTPSGLADPEGLAPCWGPVQAARSHGMLELLLLGLQAVPSPPHCSQLGFRTPCNGIFLSSLCSIPPCMAQGGDRAQAGSRQGSSWLHKPQPSMSAVWEPCLVTAPCHPCLWSPQNQGESQEPTG